MVVLCVFWIFINDFCVGIVILIEVELKWEEMVFKYFSVKVC